MRIITNNSLFIILGIILLVSIGVSFYNNSSSGILGKDESLYIFLAKGHNSNTPIDAPTGNFLDAMKQGVQRTTDPPGFFLFLHFWEKVSYNESWLRLLPLIFFVISIVTLIKIALLLKFPLWVSVCFGFLVIASQRMVMHSLEIRAYGMEICIRLYNMVHDFLLVNWCIVYTWRGGSTVIFSSVYYYFLPIFLWYTCYY